MKRVKTTRVRARKLKTRKPKVKRNISRKKLSWNDPNNREVE